MASTADFVTHVCDRLRGAGAVSSRKMFGEYALYLDRKVFALVCDDQLFVKPTDAGRALLGEPDMAPPYPGAKPHFVAGELLDDAARVSALVRATVVALPLPKLKPGRQPRSSGLTDTPTNYKAALSQALAKKHGLKPT